MRHDLGTIVWKGDIMARIRLRVKEVATEKKMSITLLSHKTYLAVSTIRAIYQDPFQSITLDTLQKLAKALEVSVFDLMEEVPELPDETEQGPDEKSEKL